jgi:hypothetical protein
MEPIEFEGDCDDDFEDDSDGVDIFLDKVEKMGLERNPSLSELISVGAVGLDRSECFNMELGKVLRTPSLSDLMDIPISLDDLQPERLISEVIEPPLPPSVPSKPSKQIDKVTEVNRYSSRNHVAIARKRKRPRPPVLSISRPKTAAGPKKHPHFQPHRPSTSPSSRHVLHLHIFLLS